MILIDALYINNGGGKILLDYLISQLNKSNLELHFLLDERIVGKHSEIEPYRITYIKGSFVKRHLFYLKNKYQFAKVFCFGNLPPSVKLNAEVVTYFHQAMYLDIPKEFSFIERLKFKLKIAILKKIVKNTDYWLVQSNLMKERLGLKFNLIAEGIMIVPFYPELKSMNIDLVRESNTYLYVSNATPNKNHKRLIEVFCDFYDKHKMGKLILTVNEDYPEILGLIENKLSEDYPIENIGFVNRLTLQKKYLSSEFLIFPSLTESFGLGLTEAIDCGCMVIGADLPYTYEVCEPTLVFNPLVNKSIFNAFEDSLKKENLKLSMSRIKNDIDQIISILN